MNRWLENVLSLVVAIGLLVFLTELALGDEVYKEFGGKDEIVLNTIAGSCEISQSNSDKITVRVTNNVRPRDAFDADLKERGHSLILNEELHGSSSGSSNWIITVPDGVEISFKSTSGDMSITGLTGRFNSSTASGRVRVENCRGKFSFTSASGSFGFRDCEGEFDVSGASSDIGIQDVIVDDQSEFSSASGDVSGRGVIVKSTSVFGSASGNVNIILGESPTANINVGSASGDARLDFNGIEPVGYFEMTAKRRGGVIKSEIQFDKEEEFTKNHKTYIRKIASISGDEPFISIGTGTGKAELRR